jgi:predicted nucleotidyltransferase
MSHDEAFVVELLRALEASGLEAIIVGTTAAVLQGVPLMTEDVDILIRDTPRNREKLARLGAELGRARPIEHSPLSRTLRIVGDDDLDVDVLFDELSGDLSFARIRAQSVSVPIGDRVAIVASLEDVIASKRAANRLKDQAQLPMLESFARVKRALDEGV